MRTFRLSVVIVAASSAVLLALACGSSASNSSSSSSGSSGSAAEAGPRGIEPAGQTCTVPTQCYGGVDGGADGGAISGEVTCLTKVTDGYCTHTCTADSECCAAPGECLTSVKEVCSPLENQGAQYCFLSCEDDDIKRATAANDAGADAGVSADAYCQTFAGASTTCRSSGGGSNNRKVCLPR